MDFAQRKSLHPLTLEILDSHIVRSTGKQKEAFRAALLEGLKKEGVEARVETSGLFRSRNVVIGNPKECETAATAHYDTPAALPFPNFIAPTNPLFLVMQCAAAFILAAGAAFLSIRAPWLRAILSAAAIASLALLYFGPPNKANFNDNTSGVATLVETVFCLSPEERGKCCFAFFDNEEKGLLGSAAFARRHGNRLGKALFNFDCVGDGDHILAFLPKKAEGGLKEAVSSAFAPSPGKEVCVIDSGFRMYPSDQAVFRNGIGVAAFHKKKPWGYCLGRIHTKGDTVLDIENIMLLSRGLAKWIRGEAK
jgi:hypothetical protein